jgi:hypothetical protein
VVTRHTVNISISISQESYINVDWKMGAAVCNLSWTRPVSSVGWSIWSLSNRDLWVGGILVIFPYSSNGNHSNHWSDFNIMLLKFSSKLFRAPRSIQNANVQGKHIETLCTPVRTRITSSCSTKVFLVFVMWCLYLGKLFSSQYFCNRIYNIHVQWQLNWERKFLYVNQITQKRL